MPRFDPSIPRRLRTLPAVLLLPLLVACAPEGMVRHEPGEHPAVARLLERAGPGFYSASSRCLREPTYQVDVIDDRHVLFRDRGEVWINELRVACPRLGGPTDALIIEQLGSDPCELDTIGEIDRNLWFWRRGVSCPLGEFRKVADEQAPLVLEALRASG